MCCNKSVLACRILLLLVYALYWGGLTFYTGFVVRIAHDVLNDPMDGGLITQRVTDLLQWLGVITAVLMVWNGFQTLAGAPRFAVALLVCSAVLSCALIGLFVVHAQLDAVIDVASFEITDRDAFTQGHRRYNQFTTLEWIASLTYLPITLVAWRRVDSQSGERALPVADNS